MADPDSLRPYDALATQVMPAIPKGPLVKRPPGSTGEQVAARHGRHQGEEVFDVQRR